MFTAQNQTQMQWKTDVIEIMTIVLIVIMTILSIYLWDL